MIELRRTSLLICSSGLLPLQFPPYLKMQFRLSTPELKNCGNRLKDKSRPDPNFAQVGAMVTTALDVSRRAADAQRFYVSLENLSQAEDLLGGVRAIASVKDTPPAFESEWGSSQTASHCILDRVLPAYEAARQTPSPVQQAAGRTVEITFVRWPTLETFPTQQVCWYRTSQRNSRGKFSFSVRISVCRNSPIATG